MKSWLRYIYRTVNTLQYIPSKHSTVEKSWVCEGCWTVEVEQCIDILRFCDEYSIHL